MPTPATPAAQQSIREFPGSETARQRGFSRIGRRVAGIGQRVQMPAPSLKPVIGVQRKPSIFGGASPLGGAILY